MIADIFNFAKMRAVFRGGPKRFGAHPGFPCFCGDRRWLVGFRRGHRNRAIITLFRMLENCYQKELPEAGCDEAGRGCLAGPVFAAAVMLPPDFSHPLLNDSKQMTERNREKLRAVIEREAVAWAVEAVSAARIDEINILNASFEGMSLAVAELPIRPGFLAIDGILDLCLNVVDGLVVYPKVIYKHFMAEIPFMATENIMMDAVKEGGNRQELHEKIRQLSMQAGKTVKEEGKDNNLVDLIAADPAFGLTKEQIEANLKPELYVGRAPRQVEVFLRDVVRPVLDAHKEELGVTAEINV